MREYRVGIISERAACKINKFPFFIFMCNMAYNNINNNNTQLFLIKINICIRHFNIIFGSSCIFE